MIRSKVSKCEGMDRVEITSHICISASGHPQIGKRVGFAWSSKEVPTKKRHYQNQNYNYSTVYTNLQNICKTCANQTKLSVDADLTGFCYD